MEQFPLQDAKTSGLRSALLYNRLLQESTRSRKASAILHGEVGVELPRLVDDGAGLLALGRGVGQLPETGDAGGDLVPARDIRIGSRIGLDGSCFR